MRKSLFTFGAGEIRGLSSIWLVQASDWVILWRPLGLLTGANLQQRSAPNLKYCPNFERLVIGFYAI